MRNRRGVSLIEVMVALVLFGIIATVHTVATMRYALGQRIAAVGAARAAAVGTATELYSSMPRASIAAATGCTTITDNPRYVHSRCVTMAAATGTISRITIVITPTNTDLAPTTITVDRVTGSSTPPFS
jgi:prepilin-type N-terminal cleavage/methylation domain-containing protein